LRIKTNPPANQDLLVGSRERIALFVFLGRYSLLSQT
jgi:hypothetical protein